MAITVGELRQRLEGLPDHYRVTFGCQEFNDTDFRESDAIDIELSPLVAKDTTAGKYYLVDDVVREGAS